MNYQVECETVSRDPQLAANTLPLAIFTRTYDHPQEAVDFVRGWVHGYEGGELPRARVRRIGKRGKLIFHAWMKPDGTVSEKRIQEGQQ